MKKGEKHVSIFKKFLNLLAIFFMIINFCSKVQDLQPRISEDAGIACAPGETIPVETVNCTDAKFVDTEVHDREWRLQQIYLFCFEYKKILSDVMKDYMKDYIEDCL